MAASIPIRSEGAGPGPRTKPSAGHRLQATDDRKPRPSTCLKPGAGSLEPGPGDFAGTRRAGQVLLDLAARGVTGLWEVYADGRIHRLALRAGRPIHVFPGDPPWRLGDVLRRIGTLRPETADAAERRLAPGSGRAGDRLVAAGLVGRDQVERALREQVRLRAAQFLPLTSGRYRFWSGATPLRGVPRQPSRWEARDLVAACDGVERDADLHHDLQRLEAAAEPYEALGIETNADPRRLRAAFREIAKRHHPDRVPASESPARRLLHRRIFEAAVRAYARACNPER